MWELDHKEGWAPNWCFSTVVKKTLESSLGCKEIKSVNSKGNQSWIFIRRTDSEAETSILWPPDAKCQLTGKDSWCWERLKAGGEGDDRGQDGLMASLTQCTWVWEAPRDGEGQGGLARCCPWGHQESDMTEQLNSNNKKKRMHHSEEKWRKWRTVSWSDTPRNSEFMMKYSAMWIKSQKRQLPSSPDIFLYVVHITSPLYFLSGLCFVLLIFKESWNRKWYLKPNVGYVLVATVSYVFFLVGKCLKQLTDISHVFAFSGSQDYWVHLEIILTW